MNIKVKLFNHVFLSHINNKPISFEVFSDKFGEMEKQTLDISSWTSNVNVKSQSQIPILNKAFVKS